MGGREFLDLSPKRVKQTSFPDIAQPAVRNHQAEADGHSTPEPPGPGRPPGTGVEGPVTALWTATCDPDSHRVNAVPTSIELVSQRAAKCQDNNRFW